MRYVWEVVCLWRLVKPQPLLGPHVVPFLRSHWLVSLSTGISFVLDCIKVFINMTVTFPSYNNNHYYHRPAGLLSLCGALCYSELGTTFVSAGADGHYLKRAFGDSASFAFNWTQFLVIGSACCAAITSVMSNYILQVFGVH